MDRHIVSVDIEPCRARLVYDFIHDGGGSLEAQEVLSKLFFTQRNGLVNLIVVDPRIPRDRVHHYDPLFCVFVENQHTFGVSFLGTTLAIGALRGDLVIPGDVAYVLQAVNLEEGAADGVTFCVCALCELGEGGLLCEAIKVEIAG